MVVEAVIEGQIGQDLPSILRIKLHLVGAVETLIAGHLLERSAAFVIVVRACHIADAAKRVRKCLVPEQFLRGIDIGGAQALIGVVRIAIAGSRAAEPENLAAQTDLGHVVVADIGSVRQNVLECAAPLPSMVALGKGDAIAEDGNGNAAS